jgi:hypothetical protein
MARQVHWICEMDSCGRRDLLFLAAAVAASRWMFRSRYLYDLDSVNFALALGRFDPQAHQPHPPGYYLYVKLGRLAQALVGDPNAALIAIGILASCGAVVAIYALAGAWFGRRAGVVAGLLFLFSPLGWFHGVVALTYIFECLFSAVVGWMCWRVWAGGTGWLLPAAVVLGLAGGVRQSSLLFLGPLWLLTAWKAGRRRALAGMATLGATLAAWVIPMGVEAGGLERYLLSFYDLWTRVPGKRTALNSGVTLFAAVMAQGFTVLAIFGLCFGVAWLVPLISNRQALQPVQRRFLWCWISPALLFFTLGFLRFVNSGYLLVASPPLFLWLGGRLAGWLDRRWKLAAAGGAAIVHAAVFLWVPLYFSRASITAFERQMACLEEEIRQVAHPHRTLLIGFDSHFLGYRHAGYYLPEYWTMQYPEVPLPAGRRVFAMKGRDTHLLEHMPAGRFQEFLLFPLPDSSEAARYWQGVLEHFPAGTLRTVRVGDRELLLGSTEELHRIFPATAGQRVQAATPAWPGVYGR